jgi:hypothetical protein
VREFRLFAGAVALALLPGFGAAYADGMLTPPPVVSNPIAPTTMFAYKAALEGFLSNGISFTVNLDDENGNPVPLSNFPFTSLGSITFPQAFSLTGSSIVLIFFDAAGNPLVENAAAIVQDTTPQANDFDVFVSFENATTNFVAGIGFQEIAPDGVENPPSTDTLIQNPNSIVVSDLGDPQFYLTVGSPSLGGNIPALTPNPNLVPEPSSILLLAAAAFLALAASRRKNSCRLLRNAGVKYQRSS